MLNRVLQNQDKEDATLKSMTDMVSTHTIFFQRLEHHMSYTLEEKVQVHIDCDADPM
ncbi:hypothetical protein HAX54_053526, partial [Datura stramonium]|nr:hypothetical protein [Datura stramonium]